MSFDWWLASLHPEDRDRILATLANGLKEGGYTAEYRIRHQDATYRWILHHSRVVHGVAGEPREIMGVWTDISEHKREETLSLGASLNMQRPRLRQLTGPKARFSRLCRTITMF